MISKSYAVIRLIITYTDGMDSILLIACMPITGTDVFADMSANTCKLPFNLSLRQCDSPVISCSLADKACRSHLIANH